MSEPINIVVARRRLGVQKEYKSEEAKRLQRQATEAKEANDVATAPQALPSRLEARRLRRFGDLGRPSVVGEERGQVLTLAPLPTSRSLVEKK
jgi:hypothetical protein